MGITNGWDIFADLFCNKLTDKASSLLKE
jgi:hypothetical protein